MFRFSYFFSFFVPVAVRNTSLLHAHTPSASHNTFSMFVWSPRADRIDIRHVTSRACVDFIKPTTYHPEHWHAEWQTEINLPKPVHARHRREFIAFLHAPAICVGPCPCSVCCWQNGLHWHDGLGARIGVLCAWRRNVIGRFSNALSKQNCRDIENSENCCDTIAIDTWEKRKNRILPREQKVFNLSVYVVFQM